jgi:hypothetical protein
VTFCRLYDHSKSHVLLLFYKTLHNGTLKWNRERRFAILDASHLDKKLVHWYHGASIFGTNYHFVYKSIQKQFDHEVQFTLLKLVEHMGACSEIRCVIIID